MKKLFSLFFALFALAAQAQVTFKVTAVPANTPATATLYMAGNFNNWNPGSTAHALAYNAADGSYQITLPSGTGTLGYKFTRGSWASVETDASNGSVPNRTYTFGSGAATVVHQVLNWEDLAGPPGGGPGPSTAAANVTVVSTTFAMPQLGRTRRVWLYLPADYASSGRRYPVLYLQDGQNVFDNRTSFAGEWGVDETLNQLQASGQDPRGCIVVAIDNGGSARLNEYSPWNNASAGGGGQGDLYVDFLVQTLKPYIDAAYRTLTDRANTGIGGSSMGAFIATYAAVRYPAVFGKVGVFSPAYWFAPQLFQYVHDHPANPNTRFYFVSGTTESTSMVPYMAALRDSLQRGGVPAANLNFNTRADGQHAEWFWRREFAAGYTWLYAPATATATRSALQLSAAVYPNPVARELRVELPVPLTQAHLEISDVAGRVALQAVVRNGQAVDVSRLTRGLYVVRLSANGAVGMSKFSKE